MNLTEEIFKRFVDVKDAKNKVYEDLDIEVSRTQFINLVLTRAEQLKTKLQPGSPVLLRSGRGIYFFIDLLAVWAIGCIAAPCPSEASLPDIDYLKQIVGTDDVLTESENSDPKTRSLPEYLQADPQAISAILFTSGSTGKPKGVPLSQFSLLGNLISTQNRVKLGGERLLINIPFHFTSAICHFLATLISGSEFIGVETPHIYGDFSDLILDKNATGFGGAPIQAKWLITAPDPIKARLRKELSYVFISGDKLDATDYHAFRKEYPSTTLHVAYGLTELAGRFCIRSSDEPQTPAESVGKPINGLNIEVVDEEGDKLSPLQVGAIIASGDYLSESYLLPNGRRMPLVRNGRFNTGDEGYLDSDGNVYVTGRLSSNFKVNGVKVSAKLIEKTLIDSGYFEDVSVIGVDIHPFGTVPVAYYQLVDGKEFKKGLILKHLRTHLPNSHIPHTFYSVKLIPRTGSGKVNINKLLAIHHDYVPK